MANVYAVKTGNWTDNTVWNTGAQPTSADDVYSNNFTVTINTSPTVLSIRNTSAAGINAGGGFTMSTGGLTLTANIFCGTATCLTVGVPSGQTAIVNTQTGVCAGGSTANTNALLHNGGNLIFVGNPTGGTAFGSMGLWLQSSGTAQVTGNATGGTTGSGFAAGIRVSGPTGQVTITGNTTGGGQNGPGIHATGASAITLIGNAIGGTAFYGIFNQATLTFTLTGNATGAVSTGVYHDSVAALNISGTATCGTLGGAGAINNSTGTLRVQRAVGNGFGLGSVGITAGSAVASINQSSLTYIEELEFGSRGQTPVSGPIRLTDVTTNKAIFTTTTGTTKTLIDTAATAGVLPAATDVRSGVTYSSGNLTGTCAVPAAGSVALGVPIDATTGTAVLTAANARTALGMASANLDTQLSALANLDATISSRSTYAGADTTGTTTLLSRLTSTRAGYLDNIATAAPSDATIAAAVWSYATGRTITGGTVDTLTNAPSVPSAAAIASQVRTELSTELARIDVATSTRLAPSGTLARVTLTDTVTTLTNAPTVPSAAAIASQVRTELTPELARVANCATVDNVAAIVEGAQ